MRPASPVPEEVCFLDALLGVGRTAALLREWNVGVQGPVPAAARARVPPTDTAELLRLCSAFHSTLEHAPECVRALAGAVATQYNFPVDVSLFLLLSVTDTVAGPCGLRARVRFESAGQPMESVSETCTGLYATVSALSGTGKSTFVRVICSLLTAVAREHDKARAPTADTPGSSNTPRTPRSPTQPSATTLWTDDATMQGVKAIASNSDPGKILIVTDDSRKAMELYSGANTKPSDLGESEPLPRDPQCGCPAATLPPPPLPPPPRLPSGGRR